MYSAHRRLSAVARGRYSGAVGLLVLFGRNNLPATLVRHCTGNHRSGRDSKTGRATGGTVMTLLSLVLILLALLTFVGGQLILKRAMESTVVHGLRQSRFIALLACAIFLMTISFFLTLGLLQRFDLSYLYPFQGLSVIIISLMAALLFKEKLTPQLTIGALLISAGVVLVSFS